MEVSQATEIKFENQVCFPLYAVSKEIVKRYNAQLESLNLTYTQYIAMMVIWECGSINVKEIGKRLFLDSGTLTPLLKTLEKKGFITRKRSSEDERQLIVSITKKGMALKEQAAGIPAKVGANVQFSKEDTDELRRLLHKLLAQVDN